MPNYNKDGTNRAEAHFTPTPLIEELFNILERNYKGKITEYLEPSAGDGRIIDHYGDTPYIAYDINPLREDIIEGDYLKTDIPYKEGRVCIMNPPFTKGLKFVKKVMKECDYCVAVLGTASILNFDYDSFEADEIHYIKKVDFGSCKVDVAVMAFRRK